MRKWIIIVIAALVVAGVGAGAYMLGMKAGEKKVMANPSLVFQQMRGQGDAITMQGEFPSADGMPQVGRGGIQIQGGGLTGTVDGVDGSTVVIKTPDGATTRVLTTDTTLIEKTVSVTVNELTVGESITVSGSKNEDGSYTARSIQSLRGRSSAVQGR
jgi:hypothetical protein